MLGSLAPLGSPAAPHPDAKAATIAIVAAIRRMPSPPAACISAATRDAVRSH
jgi:hypothetical protein